MYNGPETLKSILFCVKLDVFVGRSKTTVECFKGWVEIWYSYKLLEDNNALQQEVDLLPGAVLTNLISYVSAPLRLSRMRSVEC